MPKVAALSSWYDVVTSDKASSGTISTARRSLCTSFGNGGVGSNALPSRSHVSDTSATACMTGHIWAHSAVSMGTLVLSCLGVIILPAAMYGAAASPLAIAAPGPPWSAAVSDAPWGC